MFRRLAACSAAVLVAIAAPSSAAPPLMTDARDDWKVPSQDIVSGTLTTDRSGRVVGALDLAAPLGEVPGFYHFGFYVGCRSYVGVLEWRGTALPATSELHVYDCVGTIPPGVPDPRALVLKAKHPATATVSGDTVTWTFPALPELRRGARLGGPFAVVMPNPQQPVGLISGGTHLPYVEVFACDFAGSQKGYVVGG